MQHLVRCTRDIWCNKASTESVLLKPKNWGSSSQRAKNYLKEWVAFVIGYQSRESTEYR